MTGVVLPLAMLRACGVLAVERTKPWKMLPKTVDEAGRVSGGRCWEVCVEGLSCAAFAAFNAAATCAACTFACCCWMCASRLAESAASRSSWYVAGMESTGNIVKCVWRWSRVELWFAVAVGCRSWGRVLVVRILCLEMRSDGVTRLLLVTSDSTASVFVSRGQLDGVRSTGIREVLVPKYLVIVVSK